jgi:hypothetical protein
MVLPFLIVADETDEYVSQGAKIDPKKVEEAVKKGVEWLKSQQKPDGSWVGTGTYMEMYPFGTTALAVYALLKGGVSPKEECITKAFDYLRKGGFPGTYSVSCLILALAALCEPPKPEQEVEETSPEKLKKLRTEAFEDPEKRMRKKAQELPPWALDWLKQAHAWLIKSKTQSVWRYPGKDPGEASKKGVGAHNSMVDASNAQYAMLALFACHRLGIYTPENVYIEVAEYYLKEQEEKGPEVKGFPVPVADLPVAQLKKMLSERLKQLQEEAKEIPLTEEGKQELLKKLRTEVALKEDPYKKFGAEVQKMYARGWGYLPRSQTVRSENETEECFRPTGTMTTSGLIALSLCKVALEGSAWYKANEKRLCQAIRDAAAWLDKNWTLDTNPNAGPGFSGWRYYYFYGLERVGAMTMMRKIGEHFWYEEVANRILSEQQSDGSWQGETSSSTRPNVTPFSHGPLWNTCFAILFLKRATPPIISGGDKTIYTGEGILGGKGPVAQPPPGEKQQEK